MVLPTARGGHGRRVARAHRQSGRVPCQRAYKGGLWYAIALQCVQQGGRGWAGVAHSTRDNEPVEKFGVERALSTARGTTNRWRHLGSSVHSEMQWLPLEALDGWTQAGRKQQTIGETDRSMYARKPRHVRAGEQKVRMGLGVDRSQLQKPS